MAFFLMIGSFMGAAIGPRLADAFNLDKPKTAALPTPALIPKTDGGASGEPMVEVAKRVRKSVVNIKTKSATGGPHSFFMDNEEKVQGIGSGVIIRSDGYIITNSHVVEDADEITVTLENGDEYSAKLVGHDTDSDIAIIKIPKTNLKAAAVATSQSLEVGSSVMAIGSPWELEQSVTAGIVSALGRDLNVEIDGGRKKFYSNLIQTDAAINPGNSGGALSDRAGNVIGINTLIYSKSGGYEGVGFAIPIEKALDMGGQLIANKEVKKPYIGVIGRDLAGDSAAVVKKGAVLFSVVPNGPAETAGLREGDIIVSVSGKKIDNMAKMTAIIKERKIGDRLAIEYFRDNKKYQTQIEVKQKPDIDKTRTRTEDKKGS